MTRPGDGRFAEFEAWSFSFPEYFSFQHRLLLVLAVMGLHRNRSTGPLLSSSFSFCFNEAVTELGMGEVRSERNPVNLTLFRDICGVGCCEVFPG